MMLILWVLLAKNVLWLLEQPGTSLMVHHPRFQQLIAQREIKRAWVWMGAFGARSPKASLLYAAHDVIAELMLPLPKMTSKDLDISRTYINSKGETRVTGASGLKVSVFWQRLFFSVVSFALERNLL